ncbi:MAG: T9SS type A sorting domain-containing protein [Saprospiraceae bacterium]|nr:T9SS type A sorting domain-containing protein [Saprospiraceae bacterium]
MSRITLLFTLSVYTTILGAQTFVEKPQSPPFTGVYASSTVFADVDGDTDKDVLISGYKTGIGSISKLYTNDGSGRFAEKLDTKFIGVFYSSIAFADIDGDGDMDVLITGEDLVNHYAKLYTNDGLGKFTEVMGTPFVGVSEGSIAFTDIDGDKDEDVLITGQSQSGNSLMRNSKLYTNDGKGKFTEVMGTPFLAVDRSSIAFADVDGDADPDVLITGNAFFPATATSTFRFVDTAILYTNDGKGIFKEVMGTSFIGYTKSDVAFADVDGDKDLDVLIKGVLYTNDGKGKFAIDLATSIQNINNGFFALHDFDNDNDPDIYVSGRLGSKNSSGFYVNDGKGRFTKASVTPFEPIYNGSIAFADVDGDKDEDIVIAGINSKDAEVSQLYINNNVTTSMDDGLVDVSKDITLYPNPTIGKNLIVNYNASEIGNLILKVYDVNGKLLSQQIQFVGQGLQTIAVDVARLSIGSYLVELNDGKRRGIAKFIVK